MNSKQHLGSFIYHYNGGETEYAVRFDAAREKLGAVCAIN